MWFAEYDSGKIGRITTGGIITEYAITDGGPYAITAGPDGNLWFSEYMIPGKIGRITPTGVITEYPVPTTNCYPIQITAGPDGALWFTELYGDNIGRITTAGMISEYAVPTTTSGPYGITTGQDGALWFAENFSNKIGQAVFVTAGLNASPSSGFYRMNLTFNASGFIANESVQVYISGVGSAVLASATADASGSFTVSARAPQSPYGPRLFLGVGQTSGKLGAASFSVTPRLILKPGSGTVGSTVTAQGDSFGSFETVKIYWNNPRTFLGAVSTNLDGNFNGSEALTFTVPTGAAPGSNTLVGIGKVTGARGYFSFTVQ